MKEYWNKGFATEAAIGLIEYGFETLRLKKILSSAHVDNMASRRVMEKIGMSYVGNRVQYGCLQDYYEIVFGATSEIESPWNALADKIASALPLHASS